MKSEVRHEAELGLARTTPVSELQNSHNFNEAFKTFGRMEIAEDGCIIEHGTPQEFCSNRANGTFRRKW